MSCEDRLKKCGLTTSDRRSRRDVIQALRSVFGKEAVYSVRGSLNEHQTRELGTNGK